MSKLGDVLHELAETVGRGHLHAVIDEVEKDEENTAVKDVATTVDPTTFTSAVTPADDEKEGE